MRKLLLSCVGVLSALALLQPAAADEAPPTKRQRAAPERVVQRAAPPPQQQAARWSGGQVGGSNGVSSVNNTFVDPGAFVCPSSTTFGSNCFETPFHFSGHKATYTVGPFVGYRLQFGGWVVGLEGDWSWKNAESSLNQVSSTSISGPQTSGSFVFFNNYLRTDSFAGSVKQKSDYSIRGRVGWLVTPWSLLYVTGGVAFGEISGSFAYSGNLHFCGASFSPSPSSSLASCSSSGESFLVATATTAVTWSDTRVGSTVGAGWESELFPGWKWRAEYRWTDFGDYTKTFGLATRCVSGTASCPTTPSTSVSINLKESFHTFRIGLAFDL
jgi:outer membrane immunogenic protein